MKQKEAFEIAIRYFDSIEGQEAAKRVVEEYIDKNFVCIKDFNMGDKVPFTLPKIGIAKTDQ